MIRSGPYRLPEEEKYDDDEAGLISLVSAAIHGLFIIFYTLYYCVSVLVLAMCVCSWG